jgi:molybdate transport system regulatory protein
MAEKSQFNINGNLWIEKGEDLFVGPAQIRLMQQVIADGSIHAAAQNLHNSYQHAWQLVDKMNRLSPIPLVTRYKGGSDGGGCLISNFGKQLFQQYEEKGKRLEKFLEEINYDFDLCRF